MSSRLAMKRFSRSDSSSTVESSSPDPPREAPPEFAQRAGRAHDGGERGLQVMRDRGQKRRAQPVRLGGQLGAIDIGDQLDALDGDRRLIGQRIEQPSAPRASEAAPAGRCRGRRPRLPCVRYAAADRDAWRPGKRIGAAPGGAVVLPGPAGGGDVGFDKRVVGRIAGLDGDGSILRQQQHDAHLSIEAIWKAVAQSTSSSVPAPASFLEKR
jgi:hypothetical protein